jgi:hypothetical protein
MRTILETAIMVRIIMAKKVAGSTWRVLRELRMTVQIPLAALRAASVEGTKRGGR